MKKKQEFLMFKMTYKISFIKILIDYVTFQTKNILSKHKINYVTKLWIYNK